MEHKSFATIVNEKSKLDQKPTYQDELPKLLEICRLFKVSVVNKSTDEVHFISGEIASSKLEVRVCWRVGHVICCILKNTKNPVFITGFRYIW
jgi:hypothetical protein